MMIEMEPRSLVLKYLEYMNDLQYEKAGELLDDQVHVIGPAGEAFRDRDSFIEMMETYRSKYDLKKTFCEGTDVCVLYDFVIGGTRVYASSWYQVSDDKIHTITTVFDPSKMPDRP